MRAERWECDSGDLEWVLEKHKSERLPLWRGGGRERADTRTGAKHYMALTSAQSA